MVRDERPPDWKMDVLEAQAKQEQREYEAQSPWPDLDLIKECALSLEEEVVLVQLFHQMKSNEKSNRSSIGLADQPTSYNPHKRPNADREWVINLCEKAEKAGLLVCEDDGESYRHPDDMDFLKWYSRLTYFGSNVDQATIYGNRRSG